METFYFFLPEPGGRGNDLSTLEDLRFLLLLLPLGGSGEISLRRRSP